MTKAMVQVMVIMAIVEGLEARHELITSKSHQKIFVRTLTIKFELEKATVH